MVTVSRDHESTIRLKLFCLYSQQRLQPPQASWKEFKEMLSTDRQPRQSMQREGYRANSQNNGACLSHLPWASQIAYQARLASYVRHNKHWKILNRLLAQGKQVVNPEPSLSCRLSLQDTWKTMQMTTGQKRILTVTLCSNIYPRAFKCASKGPLNKNILRDLREDKLKRKAEDGSSRC